MIKNKIIIQKIIVGGVIINQGNQVLILQRNSDEDVYPNMWELPSGKKEPLESSIKSLIREIQEETGLDTEPIIPISIFDYQVEKENEIRDSTQINFLVKLTGNNQVVKLSNEHQNYAWVDLKELNDYPISSSIKQSIKKAYQTYNKP